MFAQKNTPPTVRANMINMLATPKITLVTMFFSGLGVGGKGGLGFSGSKEEGTAGSRCRFIQSSVATRNVLWSIRSQNFTGCRGACAKRLFLRKASRRQAPLQRKRDAFRAFCHPERIRQSGSDRGTPHWFNDHPSLVDMIIGEILRRLSGSG